MMLPQIHPTWFKRIVYFVFLLRKACGFFQRLYYYCKGTGKLTLIDRIHYFILTGHRPK